MSKTIQFFLYSLLEMSTNSIIFKIKKKTYFVGEKVFLCGGDGGGSSCSVLGKKC
jgi:hypothetical protein